MAARKLEVKKLKERQLGPDHPCLVLAVVAGPGLYVTAPLLTAELLVDFEAFWKMRSRL